MKKYLLIPVIVLTIILSGCNPLQIDEILNDCLEDDECSDVINDIDDLDQLLEDRNIIGGKMTVEEMNQVLDLLASYSSDSSILSEDNYLNFDMGHLPHLDQYVKSVEETYYMHVEEELLDYFNIKDINLTKSQYLEYDGISYLIYKVDDGVYNYEVTNNSQVIVFHLNIDNNTITVGNVELPRLLDVELELFSSIYDNVPLYTVQDIMGYQVLSYSESFVIDSYYETDNTVTFTKYAEQEMIVYHPELEEIITIKVTPQESNYQLEIQAYTKSNYYYTEGTLYSYDGWLYQLPNKLDPLDYTELEGEGLDIIINMLQAMPENFARINMFDMTMDYSAPIINSTFIETSTDPDLYIWSFDETLENGNNHQIFDYYYQNINIFHHEFRRDGMYMLESEFYQSDLVTITNETMIGLEDQCTITTYSETISPNETLSMHTDQMCYEDATPKIVYSIQKLNDVIILETTNEYYTDATPKLQESYSIYTNEAEETVISYSKWMFNTDGSTLSYESYEEINGVKTYYDETGNVID